MSQREGLRIRSATAADREAAMRIASDAMIGYGIEPDFAGLDSDLGSLGSSPKACAELVATMDGVVAGVAILTYCGNTGGKLTGFYVDPKWRGQGIGSALLTRATDAGRAAGLSRLHLKTWHFMHAAIRLYERANWTRGTDPPPGSGADRTYDLILQDAGRESVDGKSR
jgi:GNAT superfamily N-acetyltransferase